MKFNEGDHVIIKNPRNLVGTIVHPRPGDFNLPEEQRRYIVHIAETDVLYKESELEPAEQSVPLIGPLTRYSPEWTAELQRLLDAGQRWTANNNDRAAWDQFAEAGTKLGFFVPMSSGN